MSDSLTQSDAFMRLTGVETMIAGIAGDSNRNRN
jgi:hypothetical protein